ncbi:MAG: general secretion pathway protein GspB [Gammaproteobacteria bacterium]|nr:general secretion pathway protein GspB [Gammaproteobacteria bacterium]
MSSILEALERAEQERNARGLAPQHEPLARPRALWRRPGIWGLGAGLLLFNGLLWWWLHSQEAATPILAQTPLETDPVTIAPPPAQAAPAQPPAQATPAPPPAQAAPTQPVPQAVSSVTAPALIPQSEPVTADTAVPESVGRKAIEPQLAAAVPPAPRQSGLPQKPVRPLLDEAMVRPVEPMSVLAQAPAVTPVATQTVPPAKVQLAQPKPAVSAPSAEVPPPDQPKSAVRTLSAEVPPPARPVPFEPPPVLAKSSAPGGALTQDKSTPSPALTELRPTPTKPPAGEPVKPTTSVPPVKPTASAQLVEPAPVEKPPVLAKLSPPAALTPDKPAEVLSASQPATPDAGAEPPAAPPPAKPAPSTKRPPAPPAPPAKAEPRIPAIWELPAKVQKRLKGVEINIHVYNEVPAERFVIIDMRRYREGDPLDRPGLTLERITRDGVVINYGKGRVKL